MTYPNIYTAGIASGWKVVDATTLTTPQTIEADIAIIGSGAGGGTAAEILSLAGFKVLILEEGPLKTSDSFKDMDESRAYRDLYQECVARSTSDGAIAILQGRNVGGSTTVNLTASFRTPKLTLQHWASKHKVEGHSSEDMAPWFTRIEERLSISPWPPEPNANNQVLKKGCDDLGWESHVIPRNVKGCLDSGYCSYGCPVNAKQSMLVTSIPAALQSGAKLVHGIRVMKLNHTGSEVTDATAESVGRVGASSGGVSITVKARHFIVAGGAINSPTLLLRSHLPDPHQRLGKRTFIHPHLFSFGVMPDPVHGYYGTPQSVASDHFQWKDGAYGPMGYKLEAAPVTPGLSAQGFNSFGDMLDKDVKNLPYTNTIVALLRDGFVPESEGGVIRVSDDGHPLFDYDLTDYVWDGVRRAFLTMAEIQFAAGARTVRPAHIDAQNFTSWEDAKRGIADLPLKKLRTILATAHLMGGCGMSEEPALGVVDSKGRHHQLKNLSVMDGSVFPTSIGANPQLSIYALTAQNASALAKELRT